VCEDREKRISEEGEEGTVPRIRNVEMRHLLPERSAAGGRQHQIRMKKNKNKNNGLLPHHTT